MSIIIETYYIGFVIVCVSGQMLKKTNYLLSIYVWLGHVDLFHLLYIYVLLFI